MGIELKSVSPEEQAVNNTVAGFHRALADVNLSDNDLSFRLNTICEVLTGIKQCRQFIDLGKDPSDFAKMSVPEIIAYFHEVIMSQAATVTQIEKVLGLGLDVKEASPSELASLNCRRN